MIIRKGGITRNIDPKDLAAYTAKGYKPDPEPVKAPVIPTPAPEQPEASAPEKAKPKK